MSTSVPRSGILTVIERSGSHLLQVVIPPSWLDMYPKSPRYKHVELVAELLPRISHLVIITSGGYDMSRICRAFEDHSADRLERLKFVASPGLDELFVLHAPRLRSLHLRSVETWPATISENLTHIHLVSRLNPETLERSLKNSSRLKEIRIDGVYQLPEQIGSPSKISLIPGVRLVITRSHTTVASLFALGSTNTLSITANTNVTDHSITSSLNLALPRDISFFRNLNDITTVHLKLIDSGEDPYCHIPRAITVILRCSTVDRETLHIESKHNLRNPRFPNEMETEIIPERLPAIRALNYLRPLDLKNVVELKMEGFVGKRGIQGFELYHFLQHMPALRRITTGDDNGEIFLFALSITGRSASVVVEGT